MAGFETPETVQFSSLEKVLDDAAYESTTSTATPQE